MRATIEEVFNEIREVRRLVQKADVPFLNIDEAADFLNVNKSTLYQYTAKKLLPYYKMQGRKNFFKKSDLEEFVLSKENRVKSHSEMGIEATTEVLRRQKNRK